MNKKLYFKKIKLLIIYGILTKKIVSFDNEIYKKMDNIYFYSVPLSFYMKYLSKYGLGKCFDKSLMMLFCFEDSLLVTGYDKILELKYGKEKSEHGWIEIDNYVYDPSLLLRFDKDLYYKIYKPTNVKKYTKQDYIKENASFYNEVINTKLEDFKIGGKKRIELCTTIPLIKGICEYLDDINFKEDLDKYLKLIEYDEKQVYEELLNKTYILKKNIKNMI